MSRSLIAKLEAWHFEVKSVLLTVLLVCITLLAACSSPLAKTTTVTAPPITVTLPPITVTETITVTVIQPGDGSQEEVDSPLSLEIVSVTSPIGKGYTATLRAVTIPGASCTITVYYKSGKSTALGLYPKEADSQGNVSWSWKVGTRTTPGSWLIVVTASLDGETSSQTTYFTVY